VANLDIDIKLLLSAANKNMAELNGHAKVADKQFNKIEATTSNINKQLKLSQLSAASFVGNLTAGLAVRALSEISEAVGDVVVNAREYETALIGLGKTTNTQGKELASLGDEFIQLSRDIPVATTELIGLGKVAAQLGVKGSKDLIKFTDTMARLKSATDIAGESGAISMARLLNVTSTGIQDVDKVGSAIVELGNNFEVMEGELLDTATSIGQSTAQFKFGAADVLALGTALKSFGVDAAVAGTSTATIMQKITLAVTNGGSALKNFADAANVSTDTFVEAFRDKPIEAFKLFAKGLNGAKLSAEGMTSTLQNLGLVDKRVIRTVNAIVTGYDKYTDAVETANRAIQDTTALMEESEAAFKSSESKIQKLDNAWFNLSASVGLVLKPFTDGTVDKATSFMNSFADGLKALDLKGAALEAHELNREINRQKDIIGEVATEIERLKRVQSGAEGPSIVDRIMGTKGALTFAENSLVSLNEKLQGLIDKQNKVKDGLIFDQPLGPELPPGFGDDTGGGEGAEKQKSIKDAFRQEELTADLAHRIEMADQQGLFEEESFLRIQNQLGSETALRLAEDAKKLVDAGKFSEAINKIGLADAAAQKKISEAKVKIEKTNQNLKNSAIGKGFTLAASLAKDGSKEQFLIQKAAAVAQVWINDGIARAAAIAQTAAIPYPANLAALAQMQALITTNTTLSSGIIAASAIKGFEHGGFLGGDSPSGDKLLFRGNSGEAVITSQQQRNFMRLANGSGAGGGGDIVVRTSIVLDGLEITESVSRHVANGFELGEVT
jgi:TP901 family phage tail tape measure protein